MVAGIKSEYPAGLNRNSHQRESEIIDAFLAAQHQKIRSFFAKDTLRYAA